MKTVRQQAKKCKDLRKRLVAWVSARPGVWTVGDAVADAVKVELAREHLFTSGEVLKKELRAAVRKGEIRKRINDKRMVEYTAIGTETRGPEASREVEDTPPTSATRTGASGLLFDVGERPTHHGEPVGGQR